ncbi:HEPN domain-containing protein [Bradyrhizobium sp. BRP56]|uniref:HEPN domain-containing protein n=1 Tax=Bradyrhizobium sp. BRP56 TaxID=2793819 RepID=UPI001CD3512D|nr:HEPN domain-containing protein [Bradyrhizobium sp. BRP56]MCA1396117.1 hypothetical protein [Bradyrhizobium sp. BRP56]
MATPKQPAQLKDKELVEFATTFLQLWAASAKQVLSNAQGLKTILLGKGPSYAFGPGGGVEITDEIGDALRGFVLRAAKLLGSKAAHEKAISGIAMNQAHEHVAGGTTLNDAVTSLIQEVFAQANSSFEYLAPNYLFQLHDTVKDIRIGPVRVLRTSDFSAERQALYPNDGAEIVPSEQFYFQLQGPKVKIGMRPVCWLVGVDAVAENVEEEGKWLIDVAVSFLRLNHASWQGHFPGNGEIEPHPARPWRLHNEGVKIQGPRISAGGSAVPTWYLIEDAVLKTTNDSKFVENAKLIFEPPKKSLAERVSQGLGWLTRGRQAEDRAERLLYFFTAIEALLSNDDKTAPVVQTIARHGSVLLTDDNAVRPKAATNIKQLYSLRSSLVHAGNRSMLWSATNGAQALAEQMFYVVLDKADLKMTHANFCDDLAAASYGVPWPTPVTA